MQLCRKTTNHSHTLKYNIYQRIRGFVPKRTYSRKITKLLQMLKSGESPFGLMVERGIDVEGKLPLEGVLQGCE